MGFKISCRYLAGESLDTQIKIIRDCRTWVRFKSYSDNVHYHRLIKEFFRAKEGLTNLRNTYLKDGKEMGDIDNLIYIMDNQLNAIRESDKLKAEIKPPEYISEEIIQDNMSSENEEELILNYE